jgi:hypothetical protein
LVYIYFNKNAKKKKKKMITKKKSSIQQKNKNQTFKCVNISLVMVVRLYLGIHPQSFLACESSKDFGQLSAIFCLIGYIWYKILKDGIYFFIYSAIYFGLNDIPCML